MSLLYSLWFLVFVILEDSSPSSIPSRSPSGSHLSGFGIACGFIPSLAAYYIKEQNNHWHRPLPRFLLE